ncbi:hypothetical protein D9M71_684690 [compost metagenome]
MAAGHPRVGHRTEQVGRVVEAFDLEALDGHALEVTVIGHQAFTAGIGDAFALGQLCFAADAGGLEDLVLDFIAKQRGADLHAVVGSENVGKVGNVTGSQGGDAFRVEVAAAGGATAQALDFVLFIQHRRAPGLAVIGKEGGVGGGFPEQRQAR